VIKIIFTSEIRREKSRISRPITVFGLIENNPTITSCARPVEWINFVIIFVWKVTVIRFCLIIAQVFIEIWLAINVKFKVTVPIFRWCFDHCHHCHLHFFIIFIRSWGLEELLYHPYDDLKSLHSCRQEEEAGKKPQGPKAQVKGIVCSFLWETLLSVFVAIITIEGMSLDINSQRGQRANVFFGFIKRKWVIGNSGAENSANRRKGKGGKTRLKFYWSFGRFW